MKLQLGCHNPRDDMSKITAGEKWRLQENIGDPFPPIRPVIARILEVKDGWVRYSLGIFNDQRMPITRFTSLYVKCERSFYDRMLAAFLRAAARLS